MAASVAAGDIILLEAAGDQFSNPAKPMPSVSLA